MSKRRLLLIGLGLYLLLLLASAPATLVDGAARDASGGRVRVVQAQGTLWSGSGQLEIRDPRGGSALVRPVAWRLRPLALFGLRLGYVVALGADSPPFPLTVFFSRVEVADAAISLPASALAAAMPKLQAYGVSGDVQVQIASLSIASAAMRGNATLQWRGASSALAPVSPLGDYQLRLEADGAQVRSTLMTLQGPLQLNGHGAWPSGSKPEFFATAQVQPPYRRQLAPFLRLIAVERRDGSFEWRLQ